MPYGHIQKKQCTKNGNVPDKTDIELTSNRRVSDKTDTHNRSVPETKTNEQDNG